jgi:hypothetical protein
MPTGYYVDYGGQFESAEEAMRTIGWQSMASLVGFITRSASPRTTASSWWATTST